MFFVFIQQDPFWILLFRKLSLALRKTKINYCDICNLLLFKYREKQLWLECFLFEILILILCCICSQIFWTSKVKVCQSFCYRCNNNCKFNLQNVRLISIQIYKLNLYQYAYCSFKCYYSQSYDQSH